MSYINSFDLFVRQYFLVGQILLLLLVCIFPLILTVLQEKYIFCMLYPVYSKASRDKLMLRHSVLH